jgi:CubicO group peptidase (beta-lactamase class C family)
VLCLLLVTCWMGACSRHSLEPGAPLEAFAAHLEERVPTLLSRYGIPGAALAIVQDGRVTWSKAYGEADRDLARPMTPDSVFEVASISKAVTAWGVMRLVEEGRVDLDAPVWRYLTRWTLAATKYDRQGVTVRRLLSHSSGLSYHIFSQSQPDAPPATLEDMLSGGGDSVQSVQILQVPGSGFLYSNPGYMLLQLMIEEVSGLSFADYMKANVLNPLGMESASFDWGEALRARTAVGYEFNGRAAPGLIHTAQAAGGLRSTASELAHIVAAGMHCGECPPGGRGVLRPETVALLHTPVVETQGLLGLASDAYGLGYFIETLPGGQRAVMHGGENTGWISQFFAVPETGDGIVILTNSERSQRFVAQVAGDWAWWSRLGSVKMSRAMQNVAVTMQKTAGLFLLLSLWLLWRLLRGLRSGSRNLDPKLSHARGRRLLQVLAALLLLWLWWGLGQAFAGRLLPLLSGWLGASLSSFSAVLLLVTLFAAQRNEAEGS